MTDPLVVDRTALEAVVRRIATIADHLGNDIADQIAKLPTAVLPTALADSAVSRLAAPRLLTAEFHRISAAVHEWVRNVRRSEVALTDAEGMNAGRFSTQ